MDHVYLGKRVPDTGKKGLDNVKEVEGISKAILRDYETGKIDRAKAARRLNLLKLVVMRDRDFRGAKRLKAIKIVDKARNKMGRGTRRSRGRR